MTVGFIERVELALKSQDWLLSKEQAIERQYQLAKSVVIEGKISDFGCIAGIDVGYSSDGEKSTAAVVILDESLKPVESATAVGKPNFPYIPGLLSFREIPVILEAMSKLSNIPEILICDGGGYAHPRRFGLASHLGVLLELPSIGVVKTPYVGIHDKVGLIKGSWEPLVDKEEIIGAALRTRYDTRPLYISPGHLLGVEESVRLILSMTKNVRQPEPIRWAHHVGGGGKLDSL